MQVGARHETSDGHSAGSGSNPGGRTMAVPREVVELVQVWCGLQTPEHIRDRARLEIEVRGNKVTIYESSVIMDDWVRVPSAQLRLDPHTQIWSLYWIDSHDRWHIVPATPTPDVVELLAEIEADPDCLFFG